jgi:hypothetical protein
MKEEYPSKKAINTIEGRVMSKKKMRKIEKLKKYGKIEELNKLEKGNVEGERMEVN